MDGGVVASSDSESFQTKRKKLKVRIKLLRKKAAPWLSPEVLSAARLRPYRCPPSEPLRRPAQHLQAVAQPWLLASTERRRPSASVILEQDAAELSAVVALQLLRQATWSWTSV